MSQGRQLRSKDQPTLSKGEGLGGGLFEFDYINPYIQHNKPIRVDEHFSSDHIYSYSDECKMPARSVTQKPIQIEPYRTQHLLPRRSRIRDDPLNDSVYFSFHNKMKRKENAMASQDRLRLLSDLETLQNQKDLLLLYNWARELPKITRVNNITDQAELSRKRDLTLLEINKRFLKYQNWKRRYEDLKDEIKFLEHSVSHPSAEEEYATPVKELKQRRIEERTRLFGKPLNLNLHNGYCLRIDPFDPPKIIKHEEFYERKKAPSQGPASDSVQDDPKKQKQNKSTAAKEKIPKSSITSKTFQHRKDIRKNNRKQIVAKHRNQPNNISALKKTVHSPKKVSIQDKIKAALKRSLDKSNGKVVHKSS